MKRAENKVVMVTGGALGIGRETFAGADNPTHELSEKESDTVK